jgi:SAM-dependent methyltransferase
MEMTYTGERMVPGQADVYTFWEHIYRYRFAASMVKGKRVLDIACGEGYGAAALMQAGATSVVGVDISREACAHATRRYGIKTVLGDALTIPLPDASMDTIVSFETIEHVSRPEKFLDECARVLAPGGQIIISTPNSEVYHKDAPKNPYHLKELTEKQFVSALAARFCDIRIYTQRPTFAAWWSSRSLASEHPWWRRIRGFGRLLRPLQMVCCPEVVSADALERAREDPVQSILSHPGRLSCLANPFAIRPKSEFAKETPTYILAVASR